MYEQQFIDHKIGYTSQVSEMVWYEFQTIVQNLVEIEIQTGNNENLLKNSSQQ